MKFESAGKKSGRSLNSTKAIDKKYIKPTLRPSKSQKLKIKKKVFKLDKPILPRSRSKTFRDELSKSPILNLETKSDGSKSSIMGAAKDMIMKTT